MKILSVLESNASFYELVQKVISLNFLLFRKKLGEEDFFKSDYSYLDFGCGTGKFKDFIPSNQYHGIDINENYIQYAIAKRKRFFSVQDARNFTENFQKADHVFAIGLLHHLNSDDAQKVLQNMKQHLTKDGKIYIIDALLPFKKNFIGKTIRNQDNGNFVRDISTWENLLSHNLKIEKLETFKQWPFDYIFCKGT
jgi:SAM-dependent methyltransferase